MSQDTCESTGTPGPTVIRSGRSDESSLSCQKPKRLKLQVNKITIKSSWVGCSKPITVLNRCRQPMAREPEVSLLRTASGLQIYNSQLEILNI